MAPFFKFVAVALLARAHGQNTTTAPSAPSPAPTIVSSVVAGPNTTAAPGNTATDGSRVAIASGTLTGVQNGNRTAFKGVPYAQAPNAENRVVPPRPMANNTDRVIPATSWGKMCKMDNGTLSANGWTADQTSEDCLNLNVWGFSNGTASKPVIVFIHGGGMYSGSGSQYDGASLSEGADAVVVTFNYRLGVLGWLAADGLSQTSDWAPQWNGAKGNWGLMDMHLVLQWVQDEISKFGGDPTQVTITGEEAGAWAICNILSSTQFDGYWTGSNQNTSHPLYTTAIMQDGGGCMGGEQTLAQANDAVLLAARGCLGLVTSSCIWYYSDSNLWDSNRFLYSSADKNYTGSTQLGLRVARPLTVVDGVSITQSAYMRLLDGGLAGKNIVVGMNTNASTFYSSLTVNPPAVSPSITPAPTAYPVPVAGISVAMTESGTFSSSEVVRLTEVYHDDADNVQHWEALLTDVMSGCPAEAFLRAAAVRADMDAVAASGTTSVRGYYFDITLDAPAAAVNLGAAHGVDTAYLFGDANADATEPTVGGCFKYRTRDTFSWVPYAEGSSATPTLNPVLVTEMQAQWGRIARGFYGAWPLYTTDAHSILELNAGLSKHVSLIKSAINCNRCDAVLSTTAFSVATPSGNQTYTGDIRQLESYQQLNSYTAAGTASMTLFQEDDGAGNVVGRTTTVVSLTGTGLVGPVFQAHLHRNPCANGNGGPHYRHNPIGEDAVNENWPYLNCNGTTRCDGTATNNWQPRAGNLATGMSIVVHDTPGADGGMGRPYLCVDLALSSAGTYDSEFLAAVPSAMRTDCLLDTGRECVFGDNVELDLVSAGCTGSFTGGDMAGMFFGTVLLVLLLEIIGYFVHKHWDKIKHKLEVWKVEEKCRGCWRPCCNKLPCCKPKAGPGMPKAMVLDNDDYADEDGKSASDHDAEKGTVNLQPRGSEVGLTSESTVDDYEEDGQAEESQGLTGESAADEEVEEEVAYNDDGQAAV